MLGSIFIGLSGMNAYSRGLQTISNNVVNLNSPGFKGTTVSFADLFSASSGDRGRSGQGVQLSKGLMDLRQGELRQTEGDLDLAIDGEGFLMVQEGRNQYFLRTGQFTVDDAGFIVLGGTDKRLLILDGFGQPTEVNINNKRTSAPMATTVVKFGDNLSSTATTAAVTNITVHAANGSADTWRVNLQAVGPTAPGEWTVTVLDQAGTTLKTATLKFIGSIVDPSTSKVAVSYVPTGAPSGVTIDLDFSAVTSFSSGSTSSIRASDIDGNGVGALTGVSIEAGKIKLAYNNGESFLAGDVAIADFESPQELSQSGGGLFTNPNDVDMRVRTSLGDGVGELLGRTIEASNVNLSDEFGDLIVIQRAFQASSQVVSVSNDMIQELFGIRGRV